MECNAMNDKKSNMPDFKEISSMFGKFIRDAKSSICQIVDEYKAKRQENEIIEPSETVEPQVNASATPKKPVVKPVVMPEDKVINKDDKI